MNESTWQSLTTEESAHAASLLSAENADDSLPFAEPFVDMQPQNRTVVLSDISPFTVIEYSDGVWVKYLWWIYIVGLIWCSEFILGCQQMVIASSVAAWYFSR